MRRRAVLPIVVLSAVLLMPMRRADAQAACSSVTTCSVPVTLRLPRPYVARLSLSAATTTMPAPTAADFSAGFTSVAGPVVTVRSNAPYRLTVQAAQPTWSYSGAVANPGKPAADLSWSRSSAGPWTSSATSATLWPASTLVAPATSAQSVPLFYRAQWSWTTSPPGTYAIPVNITLTSP